MIEKEKQIKSIQNMVAKLEGLLSVSTQQPLDEAGQPVLVHSDDILLGKAEDNWFRTGKFTVALGFMKLLLDLGQIQDVALKKRILAFKEKVNSAEFTNRLKTPEDVELGYTLVQDVVNYLQQE